jgi:hypothetical protein
MLAKEEEELPQQGEGLPQEEGGGANIPAPIQQAEQNQERRRPMTQRTGAAVRFTTPAGIIEQGRQNLRAKGQG